MIINLQSKFNDTKLSFELYLFTKYIYFVKTYINALISLVFDYEIVMICFLCKDSMNYIENINVKF